MNHKRVAVMQVINNLNLGGAERIAVNLANLLPRDRFQVHLCSTRVEGPLAAQIQPGINRLQLSRKSRASDVFAAWNMVRYIRQHQIQILHCHSTTLFFCAFISLFCPSVAIVWHDHFGSDPYSRPRWLYKLGTARVDSIISVNDALLHWAQRAMGFSAERIRYIRNFVVPSGPSSIPELPGETGKRIVCVANVRIQKDTLNLINAVSLAVCKEPKLSILIAGSFPEPEYYDQVVKAIESYGLSNHIHLLGPRKDVPDILAQCDIGVLSSSCEGLPLSLIEYGIAGLPAVSTDVGQCREVLNEGRVGVLVPPGDPDALAAALLELLADPDRRKELGTNFQRYTLENYSPQKATRDIVDIYNNLITTAQTG